MFALKSLFAGMKLYGAEDSLKASLCPDFTRQENFDLDAYRGRWYEQLRDKSTYYEIGDVCVTANYVDNGDGTTQVQNRSYDEEDDVWTGGDAIAYDVGVDGGLWVSFFGNAPKPGAKPNYNILSTDYENYTIVYDCDNYGKTSRTDLWILGRKPVMDADVLEKAKGIVAEKIPSYDMSKHSIYTKQGDSCPYDKLPVE